MHDNSLMLFDRYARTCFKIYDRVLEIGGRLDKSLYRKHTSDIPLRWETLDLKPSPGVTHVALSEYHYPLSDESFDVIISGQVLEHVRHPWRWFKELARILKFNGRLITISPVSWPYHEAPVDCWRIYPEGMKALCEDSGLTPVFCTYDSLEAKKYLRSRPGRGRSELMRRLVLKYAMLKPLSYLGYPVPVAWDTILIAEKHR